tara:strand:+ start:987 stop:1133 length:147 start_codon:yes stop_codon:yes gene_type:complete
VDEDRGNAQARDAQCAALLACAAVVLGFVMYWWGEIESVRELLEMAYG